MPSTQAKPSLLRRVQASSRSPPDNNLALKLTGDSGRTFSPPKSVENPAPPLAAALIVAPIAQVGSERG